MLGTLEHHVFKAHNEVLPAMVTNLLALHRLTMEQITAVGVAIGPGSYTGLRVGLGFAKGLCYGRSLPLITINSLSTLLEERKRFQLAGVWCGLLDARRGYAYAMVLDHNGNLLADTHTCPVREETFTQWLTQGRVTCIGSGADLNKSRLPSSNIHIITGCYPRAANMGGLVYEKFQQQAFAELTAEPIYLSAF